MSRNKTTKSKKISEVKDAQKISSFFKKINPKNEHKVEDLSDDAKSDEAQNRNKAGNGEKNDRINSMKQLHIIDLDDSDEDFVASHIDKFKARHKNVYSKCGAEENKILNQGNKKVVRSVPKKNPKRNERNKTEIELIREVVELPNEDECSRQENSKTQTTKYNLKSPKGIKQREILSDESNIVINLEPQALEPAAAATEHSVGTAHTPEKSYLQKDQVLTDVTNTDNKILDTLLDHVDFIISDRKESPPHSTPLANPKKRKSPALDESPDVIPPTPEEDAHKRKSFERKLKFLPRKIPTTDDCVVPYMTVRSPPRKSIRVNCQQKTVFNLSDLTTGQFQTLHSSKYEAPVQEVVSAPEQDTKVPGVDMSPSRWSPMHGTNVHSSISTRKSDSLSGQIQSPVNSSKRPAKATDTLVDYFKNLPSSCEEKKQTEIDTSNFVVTKKHNKSPIKLGVELSDLNFDDSWDGLDNTTYSLNLDCWQYCKILEVSSDAYQNLIIKVESPDNGEKNLCKLQGIWRNIRIKKGNKVHILAVKTNDSIHYTVNNDAGFIVYEPDILISGTAIVGSLFCKRQGVLRDRFRGIEADNQIMIVGSLVHQLLQEALKKGMSNIADIEKLLIELLNKRNVLFSSYAGQVPLEIIQNQARPFIPRIVDFVTSYITREKSVRNDNWNGVIDSVQDIEENIWCYQLGIKGKVDVTVTVDSNEKMGTRSLAATRDILPLELKTGRASFSLEHRGQVILYTMIMRELDYEVSSGLLLYLREGILRQVHPKYNEKRDLIMLRNELAYYLKQTPRVVGEKPDTESVSSKNNSEVLWSEQLSFSELPEPINHHSACKKCSYSKLCTAFLSRDQTYRLAEGHPLARVTEKVLAHLKPSHVDYFVHWSSLVQLEATYKSPAKELKHIWRMPPLQRELLGKSISHLWISGSAIEDDGTYLHSFKRHMDPRTLKLFSDEKCNTDLLCSGLAAGSYAVVSTDTRVAVATGFISSISKDELVIGLERDLSRRYSNRTFHIDTYESQIISEYSMMNLAILLENTEKVKRLRELIIERQAPEFASRLSKSVAVTGARILKRLNKVQQRAVLKALTAQDYLLIKGMPGTGKTATIVALIQLLVDLGKTVLITSHTNSAVDNVCLRLLECGVPVLRLGSGARIHPLVRSSGESAATSHCKTAADLEKVYNDAQVIAVTCLGASHPVLSRRMLDVCIVDESTQVLQCSVYRALRATKTFVLIGDPDQLPPIVTSPEAAQRGMNQSLFERLDTANATVTLTLQYRMNKTITALANALTYRGQLLCADDSTGYAVLRLPRGEQLHERYGQEQWLLSVLDTDINSSVVGIDTGATWNRPRPDAQADPLERLRLPAQNAQEDEGRPYENICETAIVVTILEALKEAGVQCDAVGIIAPYRAQVSLLKKALSKPGDGDQAEVNTVDQYQGRDKDVIIYSCTRSTESRRAGPKSTFEILEDKRRLTVAITRAKFKLIIIGDFCTLKGYTPFELLLNTLEPHQVLSLAYGSRGFSWDKVMNRLNKYLE